MTDAVEFGDGFLWCGVAFVHLLGQRVAFMTNDFTSRLLAIHEREGMHRFLFLFFVVVDVFIFLVY